MSELTEREARTHGNPVLRHWPGQAGQIGSVRPCSRRLNRFTGVWRMSWIWLVAVVFALMVILVVIVVLAGVALGFTGWAAEDDYSVPRAATIAGPRRSSARRGRHGRCRDLAPGLNAIERLQPKAPAEGEKVH